MLFQALVLAAVVVPGSGMVPSSPASPDEAQGELVEVVVTARKRSENLLDVPLSISAFNERFIERTGMDDVVDLANQTPGLSFRPAFGRVGPGQGGGSSNRPTLRGQANITGTPNVGFFVDGVFVSGNIVSYQLDNLERIEVIRGGQSALFGRGTFAGAVNFVTREPGESLRGKVELTGGRNELGEGTGWISGPLVRERLYGELNARYYDFGGEWLNRATGLKDGGAESSRSLGGKLLWRPSEELELALTVGWAEDQDDGTFAARYTGVNCLLPNIVGAQPGTGLPISSNRRRGYWCGEASIADSFFARVDLLRALGFMGVDRINVRSNVRASYDFANDWRLTAIGAFNRFRNRQAFDLTFEAGEQNLRPLGINANEDRRRDRSLELRFESPRGARVRGLLGFYGYEEQDDPGYRYTFVFPMAPAPVPIGAVNLVTATRIATDPEDEVRNASLFGLLDYELNDRTRLTAEARYQVDTLTSDQFRDANAVIPAGLGSGIIEGEFEAFLPRLSGVYAFDDRWNVYGNVAKGNKPGGFNFLAADSDPAARRLFVETYQKFDEESAITYEIGVKGTNAARSMLLSASIYQIDWDDQQLTETFVYQRTPPLTPTTSTALVNAGQTRIRGFEVDAAYRPTDRVDLRLAYAYVDSEIREFIDRETEDIYDTDGRVGPFNLAPADSDGSVAGAQVPQSPKHQLIASAGYTRPMNERWTVFARGDATYESKRYDQVHDLAHTGDSTIANLRLGIETGRWTLTAFVNNLTDEDAPMSLTRLANFSRQLVLPSRQNPAVPQTTNYRDILVTYPRRRSYGLTVNYSFGDAR